MRFKHKLTEKQQREIQSAYAWGKQQTDLAKKYGVSRQTISAICARARKEIDSPRLTSLLSN